MSMKKSIREWIERYPCKDLVWFARLLIFSYSVSLAASAISFSGLLNYFYFLDLLSHFKIQYAIGGLVLAGALFLLNERRYASICLCIFILCSIETRWHLEHPFQLFPDRKPGQYRIVSYNHHLSKTDFSPIITWLSDESSRYDAVVFLEASKSTVDAVEKLKDIYPYQIHEPREHCFGMVVLSRHPFIDADRIPLNGPYYPSFAARFTIQPPDAQNPLTVYALHPHPPSGPISHAQRDFELMETAKKVKNDNGKNIIMVGDWNITPFAPAFGKILTLSGLNYQSYGLLLNPTWPSFNMLSFLKIPIDHALYSDNLVQVRKEVGPAFKSDHHALIVGYAERSPTGN